MLSPLSISWQITVGLVTGLLIGLPFFGGLWWTTKSVLTSQNPALLMLSSLLLRMSLLAVALFVLAPAGPVCMIAATVGLLIVRYAFVFWSDSIETGVRL